MLSEIINNMEQISAIYDINEAKSNAYYEAAVNEYIINCKTAKLKVLQESGTDEDLLYLEAEAEKSFIDKITDSLKSILNTILTFFKNIIEKITNVFKKNEDKINKLEKIAKSNKEIGNAKIEIPDVDSLNKAKDEALSKLDKYEASIKAGKNVDDEDIDKVANDFSEKKKKILIGAGAVTCTVIAGIALYKKLALSTPDYTKDQNIFTKGINSAIEFCNNAEYKRMERKTNTFNGPEKDPTNIISKVSKIFRIHKLKGLINKAAVSGNYNIMTHALTAINRLMPASDFTTLSAQSYGTLNQAMSNDVRVSQNKNRTLMNMDPMDRSHIGARIAMGENTLDNIDDYTVSDVMDYNNDLDTDNSNLDNDYGYNEGCSDKFTEIISRINTDGLPDRSKFGELQNKIYNNLNTSDLLDDNNDNSFFA